MGKLRRQRDGRGEAGRAARMYLRNDNSLRVGRFPEADYAVLVRWQPGLCELRLHHFRRVGRGRPACSSRYRCGGRSTQAAFAMNAAMLKEDLAARE